MMRRSICRASIALVIVLVNAAAFAETAVAPAKLRRFVKQFSQAAEQGSITAGRAALLGLDRSKAPFSTKFQQVESTDGYTHMLEIVLDGASRNVVALVVSCDRMLDPEHEENHFFRLSTKGQLQLVAYGQSLYKDGNVIKGAGKATRVDLNAPGVQDEFKRELDFWLSGKYRQKAPAQPTTSH